MIFATFPYQALFQSVTFQLVGRSASGGMALSGDSTRVASNSAHWKASATFLIKGEDGFLAWQGFLAQMQGVLGETLVPAWSRIMPYDANGGKLSRTDAVNIGGGPIADNMGFGQTEIIHAKLRAAASLRDGAIKIKNVNTTGVRPGHRIGIGERYHEVLSVSDVGNNNADIRVQPLLRKGYANNTRIILDRPVCRMRFETEGEGVIPFDIMPVQSVTVNFREVTS